MKIFVHPVAYPYTIAYTVESRDVYSGPWDNRILEGSVWDVYYEDHFGCIAQGFGTPDDALEWLTNKDDREYFVWKSFVTSSEFDDDKFLRTENISDEGKVK